MNNTVQTNVKNNLLDDLEANSVTISEIEAVEGNLGSDDKNIDIVINNDNEVLSGSTDQFQSHENILIKCLATSLVIVMCSPVIIADLYYAYSDNSCVYIRHDALDLTMKQYLLVGGYSNISILLISLYYMVSYRYRDQHARIYLNTFSYTISYLGNVFNLIWDILGGVIFWDAVYKSGLCSKNITQYLFTSLIIKYAGSFMLFNSSNKK